MLKARAKHANCSVVGCNNPEKNLFRLPLSVELNTQWIHFIFDGNVPTTTPKNVYVCASHFTADCFLNKGQYKSGFASRLKVKDGSLPTVRGPTSSLEAVEKVMSVVTTDEGIQYEMSSCNNMEPPPSRCVPLKHSVSTQTFYYRENFKNKAVQVWPNSTNVGFNTSLKENLPHNRENSLCSVMVYMARKYVVYEDCLLPLFKTCPVCHGICRIDQFVQDTLLTIKQTCDHCDHRSQWRSCSFNLPVGNLSFSVATNTTSTSTGPSDAVTDPPVARADPPVARADPPVARADPPAALTCLTTCTSTKSLTDASTGPPVSFAVQSLETRENDDLQLDYDEDVCNNSLEDVQTLVFETTLCLENEEEKLSEEEDGEEEEDEKEEEEDDDDDSDEDFCLDEEDSQVLCPDCGTLTKSFKAHVCEHIKPFHCEDCGKRFINQNSLEHHSIVHQSGYVHKCMYCLKSFQNRPEKLRHEESHPRVDKPFKCPHCHSEFRSIKARDKHVQSHGLHKQHLCEICKLEFTGAHTLKRHMLVHSKEKPYTCPECERSFNQAGHLKSHMRLHTGERPYKCQHCTKSFNHNVSLKSHIQRYHPVADSGTEQQENNSETQSEPIQLVDIVGSQVPNIETGPERVNRATRKRKQPIVDPEESGESQSNTDSDNNSNGEGSDSESEFNPEKGMGSDSDSDFNSEGKKKYRKKRSTGRPKGRPVRRPESIREVHAETVNTEPGGSKRKKQSSKTREPEAEGERE